MRSKKMLAIVVLGLGLMFWLVGFSEAAPMGTAWTYQGRLMDVNGPADGLYDFAFGLYSDPNLSSTQIGSTVYVNDVDVIDGYFTVELDFNSPFAFNGYARWLEISVRPGDCNDVNDYVTLTPRQEVTPAPYALQTRGIFVDDAENVGMGTTSPKGKLHVDGGKAADDTDAGDITIKAQGGGDAVRGIRGGRGGDIILLPGEGGESPPLTKPGPSGNVGIGTAGPEAMLDVRGNIQVDQKIQAYDSGGLELATDEGTTRIFIGDDGNVGIGTSEPEEKLHVEGNVQIDGSLNCKYGVTGWSDLTTGNNTGVVGWTWTPTTGTNFAIIGHASNTLGLAYAGYFTGDVYASGRVGIGTTSPVSKLDVAGGCITGSMCSDIRLKKNIKSLPDDSILDRVMGLQAVTFEWKDRDDGKRQIGLIAQEVEGVFPEVVTTPDDGTCEKGLLANGMDAVLIEAIKELKVENELLEARLAKLEAMIAQSTGR